MRVLELGGRPLPRLLQGRARGVERLGLAPRAANKDAPELLPVIRSLPERNGRITRLQSRDHCGAGPIEEQPGPRSDGAVYRDARLDVKGVPPELELLPHVETICRRPGKLQGSAISSLTHHQFGLPWPEGHHFDPIDTGPADADGQGA